MVRAERAGTQRFCSPRCANGRERRGGNRHHQFNGGLCVRKDGRCVINCRDGSLMYFYRAVMAAHLGRLLRPDELVHHDDEDPTNDALGNLILTTRAGHIEMHRAALAAARA